MKKIENHHLSTTIIIAAEKIHCQNNGCNLKKNQESFIASRKASQIYIGYSGGFNLCPQIIRYPPPSRWSLISLFPSVLAGLSDLLLTNIWKKKQYNFTVENFTVADTTLIKWLSLTWWIMSCSYHVPSDMIRRAFHLCGIP